MKRTDDQFKKFKDLKLGEKRILKICHEYHKQRKKSDSFQIWTEIQNQTGFDGKKISRIKTKLIKLGLINKDYFIKKESIDDVKWILLEDSLFKKFVDETTRFLSNNTLPIIFIILIVSALFLSIKSLPDKKSPDETVYYLKSQKIFYEDSCYKGSLNTLNVGICLNKTSIVSSGSNITDIVIEIKYNNKTLKYLK